MLIERIIDHVSKDVFSELLKQLEYSQGSRVVSLLWHNSCEIFYSICTIVAMIISPYSRSKMFERHATTGLVCPNLNQVMGKCLVFQLK